MAGQIPGFGLSLERSISELAIKIYGYRKNNDGTVSILESTISESAVANAPEYVVPMRPLLSIEEEQAEQLMTELWRLGVRPRNGEGSLSHVEASRRHLEDMRRIAFHCLELEA